ncbi:ribonuclease domain-containing protein [Tumidithrix elongata RA019]|uniref:Ribonuclease domain-containing protein n=1 Tax=Tumidithrix elongata BACA0141 TaxID=2716417 RepID=A0AAW9PZZ9_9CYAN|nr:ribonuclease domain-containing protein [Tumidithrix elongata RA019]
MGKYSEYIKKPTTQPSIAPQAAQLQARPFAPPQIQTSASPQSQESTEAGGERDQLGKLNSEENLCVTPQCFLDNNRSTPESVMQRKWESIIQRAKEGGDAEFNPYREYTPVRGSSQEVFQRKWAETVQRYKENRAIQAGTTLPIQAKLAIAESNDNDEQKVDEAPKALQREAGANEEEEEAIQGKFETDVTVQTKTEIQPNQTGMPDRLKDGIESLSGIDVSDVRVHKNSPKPSQIDALAYAQGNDIHLASGQEEHLPHEAWHVVQQKQGRVQPTLQTQGVGINDDTGLETEADVMGAKASSMISDSVSNKFDTQKAPSDTSDRNNIQRTVNAQLSSNVIQRATSEWLKGRFGYPDTPLMQDFRNKIGDTAFQVFLKYSNEQIESLVDFFKAQPNPILRPQEQCDLLVPLVGTADLPLMKEALAIANYDPTAAPAIKDYLFKYQAKGVKALAIKKLGEKGNDPVAADLLMTELEKYNFHESVKNKVENLGNQKATDEYDEAVEENKQKRESYITSYTENEDIDVDESDETIAESLSNKKATLEYDTAVSKNIVDRETFISTFKKETGVDHTHTFTKNEVTKITPISKGLAKIFPHDDSSSVVKVKELIESKLKQLDRTKESLDNGLEGKKETYKNEVTKKLGEFETKKGKLDSGLEGNKAKYKDALKLAITPLFAFPDSEAASEWVLTSAGADDKKATKLVAWFVNGLSAKISLTDIQKIFTVFSLEKLENVHIPVGGTDAKAQALMLLLNEAKTGEDVKFKTLIDRDETEDFTELLTFFKKANSDIDKALTIFSKKDSSKDVNKLLGDLTVPTVVDPLQEGEDYLKHKGKAADASFLIAKSIPKVDSEKMLAKTWIVGHGEQVAFIYGKSGNNVTRTIAVLDILKGATKPKTPVDVKKWLDLKHTFNNIYNKLQADKDQQFWAGESCAESSVSVTSRTGLGVVKVGKVNVPVEDTVNTVIASCRDKVVGQFHSGGNFGNLGNGAGQTGMVLPDNVGYREYDIKPYKDDPSRGTRRVVVGGANYYYTGDHYKTFTRFRS